MAARQLTKLEAVLIDTALSAVLDYADRNRTWPDSVWDFMCEHRVAAFMADLRDFSRKFHINYLASAETRRAFAGNHLRVVTKAELCAIRCSLVFLASAPAAGNYGSKITTLLSRLERLAKKKGHQHA